MVQQQQTHSPVPEGAQRSTGLWPWGLRPWGLQPPPWLWSSLAMRTGESHLAVLSLDFLIRKMGTTKSHLSDYRVRIEREEALGAWQHPGTHQSLGR